MLNVRVVKIGGNALDDPAWVAQCARGVAKIGPAVVVHGGGQAVSAWSRRLGIPVEQRDGLRVTTPEIAQLVEMVLGGPMNRVLVTALRAAAHALGAGVRAVRIGDLEMFVHATAGTRLLAAPPATAVQPA